MKKTGHSMAFWIKAFGRIKSEDERELAIKQALRRVNSRRKR